MARSRNDAGKSGVTELGDESLSPVQGGNRDSFAQKVDVNRKPAADTSTSQDDVFIDGKIITASIC